MTAMTACTHLDTIRDVEPSTDGCEECLEMGDTWVHLRLCRDSSKNRHARKHAHRESHPIVQSYEPGESWRWCYVDEVMV
jgi:hypothetical protein